MDFDRERKKRLQKYIKEVERAFEKMISEASSIVLRVKLTEELFKFKKNPKIIKDIDRVLQQYNDDLVNIINTGTATEWQFANEKINHLKTLQLQRIASKIPQTILVQELEKLSRSPRNTEALKSFQQRKMNDFTISDRVWSITEQMRNELEFAIDVSLAEGKSANQLAREIKKHLNEPDRLYRRVRDKHGNLVLSKNAKNFHPGQGVYRSSHKNALRLAKEEINTAYRESEQLRIMQNNDIVGVEIHLSPSHKIYDICDELKGRYPKDFKWSKWHIGCMCHRRVIMKTDEEFIRELKNGENLPPESSENFVSQPPKNFTKWVEDNEERFKNWKRKPNFLEENKGYWGDSKKIKQKVDKILKPRERRTYVAFEPFSPIVREKLAELKNNYQKKGLFNEILNDKNFKTISINEKTKKKTILHPQSREPDSKNWEKTQAMAKALNQANKDVIFLPEYKDKPSADALLEFKGKYTIADFKYFTSNKASNIANELKNTYKDTPTIVMQFEKIDTGILKNAIEELKRKESLGNMIIVNKYGKVFELDRLEIKNNDYIKK